MSTERRRIDIIRSLVAVSGCRAAAGIEASVGMDALDDCAVIPVGSEHDLVVGSDFVRGEGFHLYKLGLLSHFDIGYYLVGANASDLAAMGASPLGLLAAVRYRADATDDEFEQVMAGIIAACSDLGMPLLGGDTGGYEAAVLSASAFGLVPSGRALLRANGRANDRLFLSGDIGVAGAALAYFLRAKPEGFDLGEELERRLLARWKRVAPATKQGAALVAERLSSCAIDTSDGFKASCRQLAEASGLDVIVDPDKLPIPVDVIAVARALAVDATALAVGDSVDFRLLFTTSEPDAARVAAAFADRRWPLFEVGVLRPALEPSRPRALFETAGGPCTEMPGVEWAQSSHLAIDALRKGAHSPP